MEKSPVSELKKALEHLYESKILVEKAFSDFESQDLAKENEKLRDTIKSLTEKIEESEKTIENMKNDYSALQQNFKSEIRQKWINQLDVSEKNMENYLSAWLETETSQINNMRDDLTQRAKNLSSKFNILEEHERGLLQTEINELKSKIDDMTAEAQRRADDAWAELLMDKAKAIENIGEPAIEDNTLKAVKNFFNLETFFGLRLVSFLGILLIIIGVFTFGRYFYERMTREAQCIFIFALGMIFLITGEILNRKWRGVFSLAITAGGSGILFLATALGYLTLNVLSMQAALGICAGVSAVSFVLAVRHNSQIISVFALIGGYLPILALNGDSVIWGIIYFTILNLFSLALATRKNWSSARFIGLFSGLLADFIMVIGVVILEWYVNWNLTRIAVIASIAAAYTAYLIIPVFGAMFTKTKIKPRDIVLLSCNIFFRFLIGLFVVEFDNVFTYVPSFFFKYSQTIVCVFFALTCIIMAILAERGAHKSIEAKDKGSLRALFFITSVTFTALIVLFWFDRVWFSSGWLVQGTGLILYGLVKNRRRFIIAGSAVGAVCLCVFITVNAPYYTNPLFVWQYLLVTLGITAVAVVLAIKKIPQKHKETQIFQFISALNVWIFAVYLLQNPVLEYIRRFMPRLSALDIIVLICIIFGMLYSYILPRIRAFYCTSVQAASVIVGVISVVWLLWFNALSGEILRYGLETAIRILVMSLYIMTNIIGVFWMRDLLQYIVLKKALPIKFYPLLLSGYFVLSVSQNFVVQLNLQPSSMVLTLIFGVTALGWIIFGFYNRNNIIRVSGLSMSFFSVIKLFILDLRILSTELKIISYFIMGGLLLAISFIYQYFNKKLRE